MSDPITCGYCGGLDGYHTPECDINKDMECEPRFDD